MVDEASYTALGDRFRALWMRSLPPEVKMNVNPVYDNLVRHYCEPGRYYHDWTHLKHCLREFDRAAARMEIPDAVELALWFHDAVYVPGGVDNEQLSADLFCHWGRAWFSPELVDKVAASFSPLCTGSPPIKATSPTWWISICPVSASIGPILCGTR